MYGMLVFFSIAWSKPVEAQQEPRSFFFSGKIVTASGRAPLPYANVVLWTDSVVSEKKKIVAGSVTDSLGFFSLRAQPGRYTLTCSMIGFKPEERIMDFYQDSTGETIVLEPASEKLKEVVVSARYIQRKADRFIMTMQNNPLVENKMVGQILSFIPGVWGLSIYGRANAKVYINDRELKMPEEDIRNYLVGLPAENVLKVEVIPNAGAEASGENKGGMIKITLRKVPAGGLWGVINAPVDFYSNGDAGTSPGVTAAFNRGKISSFTYLSLRHTGGEPNRTENKIDYLAQQAVLEEYSDTKIRHTMFTLDQNFYYEINDKHSFAFDFNTLIKPSETHRSVSKSVFTGKEAGKIYDLATRGTLKQPYYMYNAFVNYKIKLDTLGSTMRWVADYLHNKYQTQENEDENTVYTLTEGGRSERLIWASYARPVKNTFSPYLDADWVLNENATLSFGAKYLGMWSTGGQSYRNFINNSWQADEALGNAYRYREHITAGYVNFSSEITDKLMYELGVRYENTRTVFHSLKTNSENRLAYHSFFPSVDLAFPWNADRGNILSLSYDRSIERPRLYQLDPSRYKDGTNIYSAGNTDLKAYYENSVSLTQSFLHRYNATFSVEWAKNVFDEIAVPVNNGDTLLMTEANFGNRQLYRLYLSGYGYICKPWYVSMNVNLAYKKEKTFDYGNVRNFNTGITMSNSFRIKKWQFDVSGSWTSRTKTANTVNSAYYSVGCFALYKINKRLNVSAAINNLFYSRIKSRYHDREVQLWSEVATDRRAFNFSVVYRFDAGRKNVQVEKAEADYDVKSRSAGR